MVTLLITSFLLLTAIAFAIYFWQRTPSGAGAERVLPPPRSAPLFGDNGLGELPAAEHETGAQAADYRATLLTRAASGDKEALRDAHASGDIALYDAVLDALVERALDSDKAVFALVSYITRGDKLRVNRKLAEAFSETWEASPDKSSTAKMLHIAALADDAAVYQNAVETALQFWRDGRLQQVPADELRALVEGEFWLLSPGVRKSGAGFLLKRRIARCRRELMAATRAT